MEPNASRAKVKPYPLHFSSQQQKKHFLGVGSATAWLVQGAGTFVLESQEFHFESESVLTFQYQFVQKNFTSKLRLCIDSLDLCPFVTRGSSQSERWTVKEVPLTAGMHKVSFLKCMQTG